MPFDANGNFNPTKSWSTNEDVTAAGLNTASNDFASGLSKTFLRDGSIAATGNLNVGSHKIIGLTNGENINDAVNVSQLNNVQTALQDSLNTKLDIIKLQVVQALPENPDPDTYYFVIG